LAADWLWRLNGGDAARRWVAWAVALTFLPSLFALTSGQISPLILLGAVLFLACLRRQRFALAGAACVLLAVKPHLVLLFWVALLLWAVRERRWSLLAGGAAAGLACTLVPLAFNPAVLGQYWETLTTRPPAQYRSPTLGTLLRLALDEDAFALQFLSVVPGLVWLAWHWRRRRDGWDWGSELPLLLLVSVVTAPYGAWPFDLVLLLPAVLAVAAGLARAESPGKRIAGIAFFALVNAAAGWQIARGAEFLAFVWMAPVLLAGFLALQAEKNCCGDGFSGPRFDCPRGTT
jgi:hypothetical protein